MSADEERDYVLGTNEEELARLGLQHRVWRDVVLRCWKEAGITAGKRVLDVGAGPGYAAADLAGIVGPKGSVTALERSHNFVAAMQDTFSRRGINNVEIHELDLMNDLIPGGGYDFSWCRWVLCFVSDPARLINKLSGALRKGGRAIFHEYAAYRTWRFVPPRPQHDRFVDFVVENWRASGGEPDIGLHLPGLLKANQFRVVSALPHVFAINPRDPMWQWPASFIESGSARLQELGAIDAEFVSGLRREFASATEDPDSWMLTPLVLEVVAEKL